MSAEEVAKAFVQHFYNAFDTNVDGLAGLYVSLKNRIGIFMLFVCFDLVVCGFNIAFSK